jgi:hypothetical protein
MAGSDEVDDNRLAGRTPRSPRREPNPEPPLLADDEIDPASDDDTDIEAVTKLMGFLRRTDDGV